MASKVDISINDLVEMIRSGQLRLPEMQRRYVWRATRVRDLLDSLYRGYPSGSILVWETDQEMPTVDMAVAQKTSPFAPKLLLDGQQRATSLSAILRGEPVSVRGAKKPIEILFNLDHPDGLSQITEVDDDDGTDDDDDDDDVLDPERDDGEGDSSLQQRLRQRTFVVASKALLADPRWIKVSDVFRSDVPDSKLLRGVVKSFEDPNFDRYMRRLQDLRKIRDYTYVMHVLDKSLSYEEVAEIFVRVNSLGVKLRSSDLALAQITSRWRDSLRLFEAFQKICDERGFSLDLGLIVRAVVMFATHQSRFKTAGSILLERLKAAWVTSSRALTWAIDFLRNNCDIEDEVLLSSPFILLAVAYFGEYQQYKVSPAVEADLRRWLYLASARGHYSGSSESFLDADISVIRRGEGVEGLLASLRRQFGREEFRAADLVGRTWRSPLYSVVFLALRARGARDFSTRGKLVLSQRSGRKHFVDARVLFPRAQLEKLPGMQLRATDMQELANLLFINSGKRGATAQDKLLAEVFDEQGAVALTAHCIPVDSELWKLDNFARFVDYRRAALANALNSFVFGSSLTTPQLDLAAVIAGGESETVEFKEKAVLPPEATKARPHTVVRAIAGLANARGGTVLIGVRDNGSVSGIKAEVDADKKGRDGYQMYLFNKLKEDLGGAAASSVQIHFQELDGVEVCALRVPSSPVPVYVKFGSEQQFFVRIGNQCVALDAKQAHDYCANHWS